MNDKSSSNHIELTADIGPLEAWGLETAERHVLVDTTMATNQPRIFAAGDIIGPPNPPAVPERMEAR